MKKLMMMTILTTGLFFTGVSEAQTNKLITQNSVGPINIEMTVAEARKALAPMTLSRSSDGEGIALIAVKKGENEVMTLYANEPDASAPIDENAMIEQIYVWDETYKTDAGVHPKMEISNVVAIYGKVLEITLSEIESREYATFENQLRGMAFRVRGAPTAGNYAENERRATRFSRGAIVSAIELRRTHYPNENSEDIVPEFRNYPATVENAIATGITQTDEPDSTTYKDKLNESLQNGVNFAGHFVLSTWGCGTDCQSSAIIDAQTGNVLFPTQIGVTSFGAGGLKDKQPLQYQSDSRLLIINGYPTTGDSGKDVRAGAWYYEWTGTELKFIKFVARNETKVNDETKVSEDTPFETFWPMFKSAVEKGDKEAVAGFSRFPLSMPHGWNEVKTEADFIKNYDSVFASQSIDAARCFANAVFEKRDDHYEVPCAFKSEPVNSERKPWVYHFELASSGWEFARLDNTNE